MTQTTPSGFPNPEQFAELVVETIASAINPIVPRLERIEGALEEKPMDRLLDTIVAAVKAVRDELSARLDVLEQRDAR